MDRMPKAPASPVLVSAPVDGLGVPLNLEARAARLLDEGQAVVLLTVVEREGSAPRAAGTRALLTAVWKAPWAAVCWKPVPWRRPMSA